MREIRTSGSVRGEGGNLLAYSTLARLGERCKTKPIPGYAGRDVAAGAGTVGLSCDIASMPRFGKQSQLPQIEPKRWRWNPPPYAGHTLQDGGRILILIGS
jgi:hypothetical protein